MEKFRGCYTGLPDYAINENYNLVFGEEEQEEKTVTINEEKFVDLFAEITVDLISKNPKLFIFNDLMCTLCALFMKKLFYNEEGE